MSTTQKQADSGPEKAVFKAKKGAKKRPAPKRSLRGAINAFCRYCIYDPKGGEGNWRQQVSACTATDCPLYPVRPQSSTAAPETR